MILRNFYTGRWFYSIGMIAVIIFLLSFALPVLFPVGWIVVAVWILLIIADVFILFRMKQPVKCHRVTPRLMNLGDEHLIKLEIISEAGRDLYFEVIDEIPVQFQLRDFFVEFRLKPGEHKTIEYTLRPVVRGEYKFNHVNVYIHSVLRLVQRRLVFEQKTELPVYPSIIQMKNMALQVFSGITRQSGIRRLRRLGHSYEFEQIKNYVSGDDYRSVNWKATSRRRELMVNHYVDEKSQQIYSVIDKSRSMMLPFNGLSLMDHAINTTLALSNVILKKDDKAGLITLSDKIDSFVVAERNRVQLKRMLDALYKQEESDCESNYDLLYTAVRQNIHVRSLLFMYTNFESMYALDRVLPILRKLNKLHLLVVVFFENSEVKDFMNQPAGSVREVYTKTIARQVNAEKAQIAFRLRQFGIQVVYTTPEDLSINTINKYLELKARGMI
jgi:uncharacterized protein (DUF58 family)